MTDPASDETPSTQYLSSCASSLADEVNLLSRLVYLNKNQHRASIWYQKSVEAYRWSKKILKIFLQPVDLTQPESVRTMLDLMVEVSVCMRGV